MEGKQVKEKGERLPGLDGLRGIAAVTVMFFHFNFVFVPNAHLGNFLPLSHAYLSVDLFFMLSGFVMAHVYGEKFCNRKPGDWRSFAIARFARLYPLFLLTTTVLVAVETTGLVTSKYVTFGLGTLALQPFMLQALHYGLNWNYPSWSISTEVAAYVLFVPTAFQLLRGKHPIAIAFCCLLMLAVLCALKAGKLDSGSQAPAYIRTFSGFSLGVLLFRANRDFQRVSLRVAAIAIFLLLGAAIVTRIDLFVIGVFAALTLLVVQRMPLTRFLDWLPVRMLGDWSYGVYLWHAPASFAVMAACTAAGVSLSQLAFPLGAWSPGRTEVDWISSSTRLSDQLL